MDEKFLQEIRRQEQILDENGSSSPEAEDGKEETTPTVEVQKVATAEEQVEPTVAPPNGQRTLFGGDV
mgnify:FL=1